MGMLFISKSNGRVAFDVDEVREAKIDNFRLSEKKTIYRINLTYKGKDIFSHLEYKYKKTRDDDYQLLLSFRNRREQLKTEEPYRESTGPK